MTTPIHAYALVTFGGDSVGNIQSPDGVSVEFECANHKIMTTRGGNIPEEIINGGRVMSVQVSELDTSATYLAMAFPDFDAVGDTFIFNSGDINQPLSSAAGEIRIHPIAMGADTSLDIVGYGVLVPVSGTVAMAIDGGIKLPVRFESLYRDSGDGDIITIGVDADETAPEISSHVPDVDAIDVAIDATITIVFSENMQTAYVESSDYVALLEVADDGVIACGLSFNASTKTLTMTPGANLTNSKTYRVMVSKKCRDIAGNELAAHNHWQFTTVAA